MQSSGRGGGQFGPSVCSRRRQQSRARIQQSVWRRVAGWTERRSRVRSKQQFHDHRVQSRYRHHHRLDDVPAGRPGARHSGRSVRFRSEQQSRARIQSTARAAKYAHGRGRFRRGQRLRAERTFQHRPLQWRRQSEQGHAMHSSRAGYRPGRRPVRRRPGQLASPRIQSAAGGAQSGDRRGGHERRPRLRPGRYRDRCHHRRMRELGGGARAECHRNLQTGGSQPRQRGKPASRGRVQQSCARIQSAARGVQPCQRRRRCHRGPGPRAGPGRQRLRRQRMCRLRSRRSRAKRNCDVQSRGRRDGFARQPVRRGRNE